MDVIQQKPHCDIAVGRLDRFAPEALAHTIDGGTFEHVQLAPGAFDAQLLRIRIDDRVFNQGLYNLPVLARGNLSDHRVTLGFANFADGGMTNGELVHGPFLFMYTESAFLDARIPARGRWIAAQFSREELETLGVRVPRHQAGVLPAAEAGAQRVARALADWDPLLESLAVAGGGSVPQGPTLLGLFEELDTAFAGALTTESICGRGGTRSDYRLVRTARDFMEANLGEALRVSQLCRACGVSYKTLERHFARQTGVGPRRYLQLARLTRARAMLQAREQGGLRIADIAMACGFAHLGRFSAEYRRHFGESPVQTPAGPLGRIAGRFHGLAQWPATGGATAAHSSSIASRK
jgi:AraC-like DNA-binding protein